MAHHKLILDDDFKEEFSLIALHCSEEAYKMAFMLNKHVSLRLKRKETDLDFSSNGLEVTFPIFEFENIFQYTQYHLVANKCTSLTAKLSSSSGLFDPEESRKTVTTYLLPDFKKIDFFLKIDSDFSTIPLRKLIADINEIKQVISAYSIDIAQIKSKNNLIFN